MKIRAFVFMTLVHAQVMAQLDLTSIIQYGDSSMQAGVDQLMVPGAVMGLATSDSVVLLKGYGYSDWGKKFTVDPDRTLFQIGSVGKLMTSIAVLQQLEAGRISPQDDVNQYLKGWQIRNPFTQSVTPFHLLTHSAGFNDQFIGYMARSKDQIQSLGEHLPKAMPSVFQEPGTAINYSNYSYALAGYLLERVTGKSFEEQISVSIFEPLGMLNSTYHLPDNYLEVEKYANGYQSRDTFIEKKMYPRHAKPAGSVLSTGKDMTTFAQHLLRRDTSLLTDVGYDLLFSQQFTNHPKLTGYSLGMEVQNFGGTLALAKGGQVTGFLSVIILFPSLDLALFISTNTQTDNHLDQFFEGLKKEFFPSRNAVPVQIDFDPSAYTGVYASERCNHETIEEMFALFRGQFTIYESEVGRLRAYHDGSWHDYQYLGNEVFQDINNADIYLAFRKDKDGKLISMHRNVNVAGISIPASYRKLSWFERPRLINDEYPWFLLGMLSYLLLPIFWGIMYFIRKRRPLFLKGSVVNFYYHGMAFTFLGLFLWNILGFFVPLLKLREDLALGLPESLESMKYFNWVMACCALALLVLSLHQWISKKGTFWFRLYYTSFSLIAFSYILMLNRWHFLNVVL